MRTHVKKSCRWCQEKLCNSSSLKHQQTCKLNPEPDQYPCSECHFETNKKSVFEISYEYQPPKSWKHGFTCHIKNETGSQLQQTQSCWLRFQPVQCQQTISTEIKYIKRFIVILSHSKNAFLLFWLLKLTSLSIYVIWKQGACSTQGSIRLELGTALGTQGDQYSPTQTHKS